MPSTTPLPKSHQPTSLSHTLSARSPTNVFLDALLRRGQDRKTAARIFQSTRGAQAMDSLRVTVVQQFPDVVTCHGEVLGVM